MGQAPPHRPDRRRRSALVRARRHPARAPDLPRAHLARAPHVRTLRVVWLVFVYLIWDAAALIVLFVLWIASGFGWKLRSPGVPARALPGRGVRAPGALLGLRVVASPRRSPRAAPRTGEDRGSRASTIFAPGIPLIVASRHAGPGDSFILIHMLLNRVHRMPRIVLAQKLQWDPAIDALLSRIPSRFIAPAGFGPKKTAGGAPRRGRDRRARRGHGRRRCARHLPRGRQLHRTAGAASRIERLRGVGSRGRWPSAPRASST